MGSTEQFYAFAWGQQMQHFQKSLAKNFVSDEFVDVTLSCEGKRINAHKIILSAYSSYFHNLFRENPCQHPIVILKDVSYDILKHLLNFMYKGEVSVKCNDLSQFLNTALLLEIVGLKDHELIHNNESKANETQVEPEDDNAPEKETTRPQRTRKRKKRTDTSKHDDIEVPLPIKIEFNSLENELINGCQDFKIEIVESVLEPPDTENTVDAANAGVMVASTNGDTTDEATNKENSNEDGTQVFICKVCKKTFHHYSSLKQHQPIHLGMTKCKICNAVLSRKYHLKQHMKSHQTQKTVTAAN